MRIPPFHRLLPLVILLLCWAGCANYQLGSMLPEGIDSVYVPTAVNATEEPLLENEVTNAVLNQLQRDGSLAIASEAEADAVLRVRVVGYDLEPLSYDRNNRSRPNQYRLVLRADIEMVEQATGRVLVRDRGLRGRDEFALAGDLTSAKRIGLPGAAEDLGKYVVSAVTEAWPE